MIEAAIFGRIFFTGLLIFLCVCCTAMVFHSMEKDINKYDPEEKHERFLKVYGIVDRLIVYPMLLGAGMGVLGLLGLIWTV